MMKFCHEARCYQNFIKLIFCVMIPPLCEITILSSNLDLGIRGIQKGLSSWSHLIKFKHCMIVISRYDCAYIGYQVYFSGDN